MPRMDFTDGDEIGEFKKRDPMTAGWYLVYVAGVMEAQSKEGNDMWKVTYKVIQGPKENPNEEYKNREFRDNLVWAGGALPRVELALKSMGLNTRGGEVDWQPAMIEGKAVYVELEPVNDRPYTNAAGDEKTFTGNEITFAGFKPVEAEVAQQLQEAGYGAEPAEEELPF